VSAAAATAATVVVPCYNEAARLDQEAFLSLADARPSLRLLFVNDGSTDGTLQVLREMEARRPERVGALSLAANAGKAEAVRQGLRAALAGAADVVGYVDADLSTPAAEVLRLLSIMDERPSAVVMGARVALLGSDIRRTVARHYTGRVFASVASLLLGVRVYDTQCGAKLFRRAPALTAALEAPFLSRWAFDVELLGRLMTGAPGVSPIAAADLLEVPLRAWRDVPGSKLRPAAMAGALKDLALIGADLRRRRAAAAAG
jgi:glycosyltransferase involved in cell wall biosynthesis